MTTYSNLIGQIPSFMAIGLAGENLSYLKSKKKKSLMYLGASNIANVGLIQATAQASN